MDEQFGGARPKLTLGRDHRNPLMDRYPLASQERTENNATKSSTNKMQKTFASATKKDAPGDLIFKEDHFCEEEDLIQDSNLYKNCSDRTRHKDRHLVGEFLPLTSKLIDKSMRGTCLDSPSQSQKEKSLCFNDKAMDQNKEHDGCEPMKKEASARDRWKKTGVALRSYLSSRFGCVEEDKDSKTKSCLSFTPNVDTSRKPNIKQSKYYSHDERTGPGSITGQRSLDLNYVSVPVDRKSNKQEKIPFDYTRKAPNVQKYNNSNYWGRVDEKEKSFINYSSGQSRCNFVPETDPGSVTSDWTINSNLTNASQPICDCTSKCSCDWSFKSCDQMKSSHQNKSFLSEEEKEPSLKLNVKLAKKKPSMGLLDHVLSSSTDSDTVCDKLTCTASCAKRRRRKSNLENMAKGYHGECETEAASTSESLSSIDNPEKTVPNGLDLHSEEPEQKSLCTQPKDILCRLKYAIPYLPEKLRRRLYSTSTDQDKKQSSSENKSSTTSKCNTENKSIFSQDAFDKEVGEYRERGAKSYGRVCDADYNGKSRCSVYDLHSEEPGQKSLRTQPKDILCGLKYAIPYLPEKLRRRLYSTSTDQDKKQSGSENKSSTTSNCNTENKSIFSEDAFDKEAGEYRERGAKSYGRVCDADYNGKSRCSVYDLHSEEPGQKSLRTQPKDILCGLKYAIPYLPEKLRRRLYSTSTDQDKKQSGSENKSSTTSKCNTENKSIFSEDSFDKEAGEYRERGSNSYGRVCDADYNGKSRCSVYGSDIESSDELNLNDPVDSHSSEDPNWGHCSSLLTGHDYSSWGIEDSELKGDNSVDELCSGLSEAPIRTDNLGFKAVTCSSTLDDLEISGSSTTMSQECLNADDELECDCESCTPSCQRRMNQLSDLDIDVGRQESLPVMPDESQSHFDNDSFLRSELDIARSQSLRALGLLLMLESILEVRMENVSLRMVIVQPDLMSDLTPPPATESVIDNIPTVCLSQQDVDKNLACPICLCLCTLGETMSQLPCQHVFHPLCIQAWLVRSGTCPVCRHTL